MPHAQHAAFALVSCAPQLEFHPGPLPPWAHHLLSLYCLHEKPKESLNRGVFWHPAIAATTVHKSGHGGASRQLAVALSLDHACDRTTKCDRARYEIKR